MSLAARRSWPYPARSTASGDAGAARIAYYDAGRGPTLLMVHTGLWSFIWRDLIARLSNQFRCVAVDSPGTGQSSGGTWPPSLDRASAAVEAVSAHLRLRDVTLLLHDLGGITGVAGAARSGTTIRGVVAINTFAWRPNGPALRMMLRVMGSAPVRELDVVTGAVPRITATRYGIGRHLEAPSRRAFRDSMRSSHIRAFHHYLRDALRCDQLYRETENALANVIAHRPMLTIFGSRNDPFGFQREWKRRVPHASELVVAGGHHFPMCDEPELVARAIARWHRTI